MLNLKSTDSIELVTSAARTVDVHTAFVDDLADVFTPDSKNTAITTATTTAIVVAPAASTIRNVKLIQIRNKDASSLDVTVQLDQSGTHFELLKCTLLTEEVLINREGVWFHYDASGGVYSTSLPVASDTLAGAIQVASQAEMEAGTALDKAVTPGRQHFHPGHAKFWYRVTVSGAVPTLAQSYNISSIADTATGQVTVNINTDFSAVNYAILHGVERANTTAAVANARQDNIRSATPAAGSFIHECWDDVATTNALADPSTWYGAGFGDQ